MMRKMELHKSGKRLKENYHKNLSEQMNQCLDELEEDRAQATSNVSLVCRTMTLALFAVGLMDIWNGSKALESMIVVISTISIILVDLIQYVLTAVLSALWYKQIEDGKIYEYKQLEAKQSVFQNSCIVLLGIKVVIVMICLGLIISILIK